MINGSLARASRILHHLRSLYVLSGCERLSSAKQRVAERWRNERSTHLCGSFEMARHLNFDRTERASALSIDAMTDDVLHTAPKSVR